MAKIELAKTAGFCFGVNRAVKMLYELVEKGEYPLDVDTLAQMVCDICYNNAKDYFGFKIV